MREVRQVPLAELAPGAELGAPLADDQGRVLFAAGTTLGDQQLAQLARRGIESVPVWVASTESAEEAARRRRELEVQLAHRFRRVADRPLMKALAEWVLRYREGGGGQ
jgi:riboflavin biosynthesis pyrimidine reductase